MNKPRVLIGTPTYDGKEYCLHLWVQFIKKIEKSSKLAKCDVVLVDNSEGGRYSNLLKNTYKIKTIKSNHYENQPLRSLAESRSSLYQYAMDYEYDYLLSIEQDVFPPINIVDRLLCIRNTIRSKKSVIGTPYILTNITQGKPLYLSVDKLTNVGIDRVYSQKFKRKIQKNMTLKEITKCKKVFKVYAPGFGCTLVDVSILPFIKVKYTEKKFRPDDAFFYLDIYKMHIPVYVDPQLMGKIIHIEGNIHALESWGTYSKKKG